jgi:TolA-binding protein
MSDLALQYLERLRAKPDPKLAPLLPLELAKTRLEISASAGDENLRGSLQQQAARELEEFLKNSPNHPLAAEAAIHLARISILKGTGLLSRALLIEEKVPQQMELAKARANLAEGAVQLQTAAAKLDAQLIAGNLSTSEKQVLVQAKEQANLDQGIALLQQAQTFVELTEFQRRGELLKKAIEVLEKASKREPKDALTWLATTWLGRCHQENDDPKSARKVYSDVTAESGEQREAAKRLARYFMMQIIAKDASDRRRFSKVQTMGEDWLRMYANFASTLEGRGVQFELANAYLQQGLAPPRNSARARDMLEKAHKIYQVLERTDNEYASRAHETKLQIILSLSQERTRGDISKLTNFEECYLRAQLEVARLNEDAKKLTGAKLEEQRKLHFKNMLTALVRALDLADGNVSADDLNYARYLLTYACLENSDYYAAAVMGEDLARTQPTSPRAPQGGAYALRAYALIVARQEDAGATKEDLEVDRGRLRRLAGYIEHSWPNDSAADIARHVLGLVALGEKNYPEAVAVLERVKPGYSDAPRAYYQLATAAVRAQKEDPKPANGKPGYQERAVAALERIPDPVTAADPATNHAYMNGKLLLADLYYHAKEFDKMQTLVDRLNKKLESMDDKTKAEQRGDLFLRVLYAKLGKAEADYTAGKYAYAYAVVDPIVADWQKSDGSGRLAELKQRDPRLPRAFLALALRAAVQDGKLDQGKGILDFLQKSFPENSVESLVQFVQQLREQVQQLRRRGESAQGDLDKMVANFSKFLDELAKQQDASPRPDLLLFLAQSYSSLDKHERAAELADRVAEPKPDPAKNEGDQRAQQIYRAARLLRARELRLNKDFGAADKALSEILASPWGQNSIEAKKERIVVLEDQERFGGRQGATQAWSTLMLQMKPQVGDNRIKEQYFDCYYHFTYCFYKNALNLKEPARTTNIRKAATYIVKLEEQPDAAVENCKKCFQELLEKEKPLKEQYDLLKKPTP